MWRDVEQTARSAFHGSKSVFQWSVSVLMSAAVTAGEPSWTSLFPDCCFNCKSGQLLRYQFDMEFSPPAVKWKMRLPLFPESFWKVSDLLAFLPFMKLPTINTWNIWVLVEQNNLFLPWSAFCDEWVLDFCVYVLIFLHYLEDTGLNGLHHCSNYHLATFESKWSHNCGVVAYVSRGFEWLTHDDGCFSIRSVTLIVAY